MQEIYLVLLPRSMRNKTFKEAVMFIYNKFNSLLIAVDALNDKGEHEILVNPFDFVIDQQETMAIILSDDKKTVDRIASYVETSSETAHWLVPHFSNVFRGLIVGF